MSSFQIERELWSSGFKYVAGVDEVGRGPIAGHLVTAALMFPACASPDVVENLEIALRGVDDSKKLSSLKRVKLLYQIRRMALTYSLNSVSPKEIDEMGIGKAVRRSMALSLMRLKVIPDYILVDGNKTPMAEDFEYAYGLLMKKAEVSIRTPLTVNLKQITNIRSQAIVKGDSISLSISAASIVAKVTRDRMMSLSSIRFPDYGFERHKGYGTAVHLGQIASLGATPIHRFSFSPLSNESLKFDE